MKMMDLGGTEQIGLAAIIGAAGGLLGRLWGTYREREDAQAAERASVINEYQRLLEVARQGLEDSETKRRTVEEQILGLLAAQADQGKRIADLEATVNDLREANASLQADCESLEEEIERLQKELERHDNSPKNETP